MKKLFFLDETREEDIFESDNILVQLKDPLTYIELHFALESKRNISNEISS